MDKNLDTEDNLVRNFDSNSSNAPRGKLLAMLGVVVVLGGLSGLLIAKGTTKSVSDATDIKSASQVKKGTALGSNDTNTFKDTVDGVLKPGGIEGEGQFHLVRDGGEDQYVYLTSSTVDLSLLKDRKIKVWGQTQKAQHAGWLMDVGRVEVLE